MTQTTPKHPQQAPNRFWKNSGVSRSEPQQPAWLLPLRKAGMARFAELGFPTLHDEDWRFTNVAPLAKLPFKPRGGIGGRRRRKASAGEIRLRKSARFTAGFCERAFLRPSFPSVGKLPDGVKVASLAAALATDSALIEKHLGQSALTDDNSFAALNQAFFLDGAFRPYSGGRRRSKNRSSLIFISIGETQRRHDSAAQPHHRRGEQQGDGR